MSTAMELQSATFASKVLQADKPVLVDFWATWCGPCRMMAPVVEALSQEYAGRVDVYKVNVDDCGDLAAQYRIMSIPTLMLFKDGKAVDKVIGAQPVDVLKNMLDRAL